MSSHGTNRGVGAKERPRVSREDSALVSSFDARLMTQSSSLGAFLKRCRHWSRTRFASLRSRSSSFSFLAAATLSCMVWRACWMYGGCVGRAVLLTSCSAATSCSSVRRYLLLSDLMQSLKFRCRRDACWLGEWYGRHFLPGSASKNHSEAGALA